jgi:hypothetical protein
MVTNPYVIKAGDLVTLSTNNYLGTGVFLVLSVCEANVILPLYVQGQNGQKWFARREGAQIVGRQ